MMRYVQCKYRTNTLIIALPASRLGVLARRPVAALIVSGFELLDFTVHLVFCERLLRVQDNSWFPEVLVQVVLPAASPNGHSMTILEPDPAVTTQVPLRG